MGERKVSDLIYRVSQYFVNSVLLSTLGVTIKVPFLEADVCMCNCRKNHRFKLTPTLALIHLASKVKPCQ